MDDVIKEMEKYAEEKGIPIMQKRGMNFLCKFIEKNNIKSILEIGTAIGYSAINMALVNDDITVVSIERDQDRYIEAIKNIKKCKLEKRITLVLGDALNIDLTGKYDMLFIDAAKAQYIKFFEKYKENLVDDGFVVSDNIDFHGFVENKEEIKQILQGADLVFITAGMGGGTGTGAAPIVAEIAKEMGILTIGIVTKPFLFEGKARKLRADKGTERLRNNVDDLIVVLNDNLLKVTDTKITLDKAFSLADDVLEQGITSITDLLTSIGEVNIDFADIKTTMSYKGKAYMGIGRASGEKKIEEAVRQAIENPLTESKIDGAKGVIFNVKGDESLSLIEINSAIGLINEKISDDANVIFGTVIDNNMGEEVSVTVIATGIEEKAEIRK